jgi:hypothetical protein
VVEGHGSPEQVNALKLNRQWLVKAVEIGELVEQTIGAALGARAVVADDIEDARVLSSWPWSAMV